MVTGGIEYVGAIIGVADVAFRLSTKIGQFVQEVKDAPESRNELLSKSILLRRILVIVEVIIRRREQQIESAPLDVDEDLVLRTLKDLFRRIEKSIQLFEIQVNSLRGKNEDGWFRRALLQLRLQIKEPGIARIETRLNSHIASLLMLLPCLNIFVNNVACGRPDPSFNDIEQADGRHKPIPETVLISNPRRSSPLPTPSTSMLLAVQVPGPQDTETGEVSQAAQEALAHDERDLHETDVCINVAESVLERYSVNGRSITHTELDSSTSCEPNSPSHNSVNLVRGQDSLNQHYTSKDLLDEYHNHARAAFDYAWKHASDMLGKSLLSEPADLINEWLGSKRDQGSTTVSHGDLAKVPSPSQNVANESSVLVSIPLSSPHTTLGRMRTGSQSTSRTQSTTATGSLLTSVGTGDVVDTGHLLSVNADIEETDESGFTPLLLAVQGRHSDICRQLLTNPHRKADIRATNQLGQNALHLALFKGAEDIVPVLLGHGVDINARDESSRSPLHYCVEWNRTISAKLLLRNNAMRETLNSHGETPLLMAIKLKNMSMVDILLKAKASIDFNNLPSTTFNIGCIIATHKKLRSESDAVDPGPTRRDSVVDSAPRVRLSSISLRRLKSLGR